MFAIEDKLMSFVIEIYFICCGYDGPDWSGCND